VAVSVPVSTIAAKAAAERKKGDTHFRVYTLAISSATEAWLSTKASQFLFTGVGSYNMAELEASRIALSQYFENLLGMHLVNKDGVQDKVQYLVIPMTCTHERTRNKFTVFPKEPVFMVATNSHMSFGDKRDLLMTKEACKKWYEGLRVQHRGWLYQLYIDAEKFIMAKPDLGYLCQKKEHIRIDNLKLGNVGEVLDIVGTLISLTDIHYIYRRIRKDANQSEVVLCVKTNVDTLRVVNETSSFTHLSSSQTVAIFKEDCLPRKWEIDWYKDWRDFPSIGTDGPGGPTRDGGSGAGRGGGSGRGTHSESSRGSGSATGRGTSGRSSMGSTTSAFNPPSANTSSSNNMHACMMQSNAWSTPLSTTSNVPGSSASTMEWTPPPGRNSTSPFTGDEIRMFNRMMEFFTVNASPQTVVTPGAPLSTAMDLTSASAPGTAPGTGNV
jgi:hypothetical protein